MAARRDLSGRILLVTGATRGCGLHGALAWQRLGAEVVVGARSRERYEEVAGQFAAGSVHPFVADLAEPASIGPALAELASRGIRPTDLVHCASAGLEPILRPLMRAVVALRRLAPGPDLAAGLEEQKEVLGRLVEENRSLAFRVNFESPRELTARLGPVLPEGGRVIAYSSVWATASEDGQCPTFYGGIAASKLAFERWLEAESPTQVRPSVLVGHIIGDTQTAAFIDRHLTPLMSEADQALFRAAYAATEEITAAASGILLDGSPDPGRLRRVYVIGGRPVGETIEPDVVAVAGRMPL